MAGQVRHRRRPQQDCLVMDGLENVFVDGYGDEQWQSIAEHHPSEHVQNGLS